jgi:NADPH:quinone reductase and related Zn-dependent oxidoreductases
VGPGSVIRADLGDTLSDGLIDRFGAAFEAGEIAGLVYATADAAFGAEDDLEPEALLAPIEVGVTDLVALGDLMDFYRTAPRHARIVVLTSDAYPDAGGHLSQPGLAQAPLAALARVLATETPEYAVRVVDIADPKTGADRAAQCILADTPESELILRDETLCAPRLRALAETDFDSRLLSVTEADRINFHATMQTPGLIDDLGLHEIPLEPLGPDQVRIRVKAVGLNFRDIMAVTGLLPEEAEPTPPGSIWASNSAPLWTRSAPMSPGSNPATG